MKTPTKAPAGKPAKATTVAPKIIEALQKLRGAYNLIESSNTLPSPEQIAAIAATLARSTSESPDILADAAMKLWFAARARIITAELDCEMMNEDVGLEMKLFPDEDELFHPMSTELPISRDQFLKKVLPKYKYRSAGLARLAKEFLQDKLRGESGKVPSKVEIANAYGKWEPYKNTDQANAMAKRFEQWHKENVKSSRSAAGKKSATRRNSKKKL